MKKEQLSNDTGLKQSPMVRDIIIYFFLLYSRNKPHEPIRIIKDDTTTFIYFP